jgi:hypothetical protein
LTENTDLEQRRDEVLRRLLPIFFEMLERWLNEPQLQKNVPWGPPVAEAAATIGMFESSKKIERYSKWLAGLTFVLIVLTTILIWRTFLP